MIQKDRNNQQDKLINHNYHLSNNIPFHNSNMQYYHRHLRKYQSYLGDSKSIHSLKYNKHQQDKYHQLFYQ